MVYGVPSWNTNHYVWLSGARGIPIAARREHGFQPSLDQIAPHLGDARLLCLCSPANPTGTMIDPDQLERIAAAVVEENQSRAAAGRPFLFLHGLAGLNEHWEDVVRRANARVRCVLLELLLLELAGEDCSIDGVTRLTVRFIEQRLGADRPVLVGNSFGGHVALRIALERPDLIVPREVVKREHIQPGMYVLEDSFAAHIAYLRERFTILSLDELLDLWRTIQFKSDRSYCVITFDDGWRDNHLSSPFLY